MKAGKNKHLFRLTDKMTGLLDEVTLFVWFYDV